LSLAHVRTAADTASAAIVAHFPRAGKASAPDCEKQTDTMMRPKAAMFRDRDIRHGQG